MRAFFIVLVLLLFPRRRNLVEVDHLNSKKLKLADFFQALAKNVRKNWDYAALLQAWNAEDGHGLGLKATTTGELADAIKKAREHTGGPILIDCDIAHDDYSPQMGQ